MPLPPAAAPDLLPSRRVRFSVSDTDCHASATDLQVVAPAKGSVAAVVSAADAAVMVEYIALNTALRAVAQSEEGALRVGSACVSAVFVQ